MKFTTLLGYASPYRTALTLSALMMLAESGMALAVPWLGGRLAGSLLSDASHAVAGPLLLALLALFALQALLKFGNSFLLSRSAEHILADDGRIVNITDMQPQTQDLHCSQVPVRHALEVKQGGFRSKGIQPGMRITGGPFGLRSE